MTTLTLEEIARQAAENIVRDNARRERILARSPGVFSGMDADELAETPARELAARELRELKITPDSRSVEEQLLDAHHAGRAHARNLLEAQGLKFAGDGHRRSFSGARTDGMDFACDTFIDKYIQGDDT